MWFLKLNRIANCDVSVLRAPPNYHTDLYGARRSVNNAKESGFHNPRTEKMGQTRGQLASSFSAWDHDRALERLPCGNESGVAKTRVRWYFQLFGLQPHRTGRFHSPLMRSSSGRFVTLPAYS